MNERREQFNDQGYGQAFRGQGQTPTYGFSQTYQPSPQAQAFAQVLEALQDPRNQWIGTGLMGGTVKGLGGLRSMFEHRQPFQDPGGFLPKQVPQHVTPQGLSSSPQSYAQGLSNRWDNFNSMKQEGVQSGLSEQETMLQLRRMNLLPPGYNETKRLGFNPGQN